MATAWQLEVMSIDDLHPFPQNVKHTSNAAQQRVTGTFLEFGMQPPIFNKKLGYLIDGHARVECLRQMGVRETVVMTLECSFVEHLLRNILYAAPFGTYDTQALTTALTIIDASGEDLDFTGLPPGKIDKLLYGIHPQPLEAVA